MRFKNTVTSTFQLLGFKVQMKFRNSKSSTRSKPLPCFEKLRKTHRLPKLPLIVQFKREFLILIESFDSSDALAVLQRCSSTVLTTFSGGRLTKESGFHVGAAQMLVPSFVFVVLSFSYFFDFFLFFSFSLVCSLRQEFFEDFFLKKWGTKGTLEPLPSFNLFCHPLLYTEDFSYRMLPQ